MSIFNVERLNCKVQIRGFRSFENQELTNEARAEAKISLTMPCKEEEGEASFTFVNDWFLKRE